MIHLLRRLSLLVILISACWTLNGCLISNISAVNSGGLTTVQATATLLQPSPCTVDAAAQTTTCTPVLKVELPTGVQTYPILIKLLGYALPVTLYDPLIVQVPASMSNFAGSIIAGPPGTPGTPLSIISGLTSVPIDTTTNLVAEPGMQLVIIDFQAPANAPFGVYTLKLQFSGTANSIKVVFAAKVPAGGKDYYVPIFPCVTAFASVPAITVPLSNLVGLIQLLSTQGCNGKNYNFAGVGPAPGPDMNQQGLTGSWYKPATDGQGVEVEVYPDVVAPGIASVFVSWFTYDTVAGGADRQRWYVLSGQVASGQAASLTIYQNTGGNFNAPPATNGMPIGTATLSFDSCTSGTLTYAFTDGSGRTGTIPLTRITQNVTCSTTSARPSNADFAFSGNWYNPTTNGQGFTVEYNPANGSLFFAWYTYAPNGVGAGAAGQRWYTGSSTAAVAHGARSIPVTLYETIGGIFDGPTAPHSTPVGTGTIAFQTCTTGTLNFAFTGGSSSGASGTIPLTRIGAVPQGCVP
jgi:hypothetical protein